MDSIFRLNKSEKSDNNTNVNKQAENIWSMLDDMASSDLDSYKKFIEKTLKEGKEAMKPPVPHMCVKTTLDKPKKIEFYINVFSWHKVPAPKTDEDPIPVCGSPVEHFSDHSLVNISFNPEVLTKYGLNATNKTEREMLINLGFQFIENQNETVKINSQLKFTILNELHFGDLKQCISKLTNKEQSEMSAAKLINSLSEEDRKNIPDSILNKLVGLNLNENIKNKPEEKNKNLIEIINNDDEKEAILLPPKFNAKLVESKTQDYYYEIKIDLIGVNSMNECILDISDQQAANYILTLNTTTQVYSELKIPLAHLNNNYSIQSQLIEAKFIKKTSILKVKIPLLLKTNII